MNYYEQSKVQRKQNTREIKVICALMCMMIMLSACGNEKKYEGTY